MWLRAIPINLATRYQEEETSISVSISPPQEAVDSNEDLSSTSFSPALLPFSGHIQVPQRPFKIMEPRTAQNTPGGAVPMLNTVG